LNQLCPIHIKLQVGVSNNEDYDKPSMEYGLSSCSPVGGDWRLGMVNGSTFHRKRKVAGGTLLTVSSPEWYRSITEKTFNGHVWILQKVRVRASF
jgi:hypothetical protein